MSAENIPQNTAPNTVDIEIINDIYHLFANGHKVKIEANASETTKTTITATGANFNYSNNDDDVIIDTNTATFSENASKKLIVFGGSKESSVDSSDITMTSGKVLYLVGGGYCALNKSGNTYDIPTNAVRAEVKSSTITMTGGKASCVFGGGMGYTTVGNSTINISGGSISVDVSGGGFNGHLTGLNANGSLSNCEYGIIADKTNLIDKFYNTLTGTANITISGDTKITYALGGGKLGCTYVNESNLTIKSGSFDEIIAGGTNGYTRKATLTVSADDSKTIKTGLISSGNRGQVAEAIININDLGQNGKADLVAIGALSGLTATDGGPNAIFDTINFNISENSKGIFSNIYLGGAEWSSGVNSWAEDRHNSLSDTNISINAPGRTIIAADIPANADFINNYGGYASQAVAVDYTINAGKTWTLTSGTLEIKEKSSITNNGTFTNNGTIVVNDLDGLISAAKIGGKIQLGCDIEANTTANPTPIIFNEKAILDLNGYTLNTYGTSRITVNAGGDLTITDSSTTGKINYTVASDENSAIKVAGTDASNLAKLTLEKCEIVVNEIDNGNNKLNGYGVYAASYSEVTSGDEVTITAGYSAISGNGLNSGAKITITGGSYTSNNSAAIYFPSTNELKVTGGTFTGKTGFDIRAGTVKISDAKINATGSYTNVADDSDSTRTDIPTVWGMGIAIIDHASYSENTPISVTLSKLTFTGTSVCDLYIGNFNQNAGKFDESNLGKTFTVNKNITVNVTDVLEYSVTKSANETSGYLIVNDLDTSSKTFTVTNLFNKGDATVENKGTIIVNDLNGLINAAAIGGNIQLAADIEIKDLTTFLTLADKTVLDLNDKTITMNKTFKVDEDGKSSSINRLLVNNGNVTIKNGSIIDNSTSTDRSPIIVNAGSGSGGSGTPKLIIDDVTITSKNEYGIVVFTGELEVKNNSSITAKLSAISGNGTMAGSNITLNGGTYTSTTTAAIFFPSTTNLIVNGGTFTGATGFDIRAGTISITNAKIVISIPDDSTIGLTETSGPSSWKMGVAVIDHSSYASGTAISVIISGTTVTGALYDLYIGDLNRNDDGTFNGTDGTFDQNHSITVKVNGNTLYDKVTGSDYNRFTSDISSGSSGGGVPITPPTDDPEPEPIVPDENNNVTVPSIDDKKADELVHKAISSGSDSISIIDTSDVKGEYTEVTVSKSDLETISKKIENNNNINSVSIETSEGNIIIEKEVLNSILETTDADSISFEIEDAKDKLTEEQKEAVGDRPVYDINIKAGNENITSFDGKTITISLPYTLKAGEDPENIVVYYVKEDGSLEKVNCTYKDGKVIFETDHLSKYVIGYEESDKPVTPDTPDDKKDDNNTIYYAVAAVIVILIIIALAYYFMKKKQ